MTLVLHLLILALPIEDGFDRDIADAIAQVEAVYPVPFSLVKAIIRQESQFNPKAISKAGAIGLMQIMPYNASRLGVTSADLFNPRINILAGVRLVAVLLKHYGGDLISALVAYNARPRELLAPLPNNGETPKYVFAVVEYYMQHRGVEDGEPRND